MNTFLDMINKIATFYYEARLNNPIDDVNVKNNIDYIFDNDLDDEEIDELDYETTILEEVCGNILELRVSNPQEFDSLLSLLTIYYYINVAGDEEYYRQLELGNIEEDYIVCDIVNLNKKEFIEAIEENEFYQLKDMVRIIVNNHLYYKTDTELSEHIDEYSEWSFFEHSMKIERTKQMYLKYHPNINAEVRAFNEFHQKDTYLNKLVNVPTKNALEFIILFLKAKELLKTNSFIKWFLRRKLEMLKDCDYFNDILYILLKYYYIYMKNIDLTSDAAINKMIIEIANDKNKLFTLYKEVYKTFINFDMNLYYDMLISFSSLEMKKLNSTLSLIKK